MSCVDDLEIVWGKDEAEISWGIGTEIFEIYDISPKFKCLTVVEIADGIKFNFNNILRKNGDNGIADKIDLLISQNLINYKSRGGKDSISEIGDANGVNWTT